MYATTFRPVVQAFSTSPAVVAKSASQLSMRSAICARVRGCQSGSTLKCAMRMPGTAARMAASVSFVM